MKKITLSDIVKMGFQTTKSKCYDYYIILFYFSKREVMHFLRRRTLKGFVLLEEVMDLRQRAEGIDMDFGFDLQLVWSKQHFTRLDYHLVLKMIP